MGKKAKKSGYTRFTAEVVTPDSMGSPTDKISIKRPQWDCNIGDILSMLRSLLLAMGYAPETVEDALGGGDHAG